MLGVSEKPEHCETSSSPRLCRCRRREDVEPGSVATSGLPAEPEAPLAPPRKCGAEQYGAPLAFDAGERRRAASSARARSSGPVLVDELVDSTEVPAADAGGARPWAPAIVASLRLITCILLTTPVRQDVVVPARIHEMPCDCSTSTELEVPGQRGSTKAATVAGRGRRQGGTARARRTATRHVHRAGARRHRRCQVPNACFCSN